MGKGAAAERRKLYWRRRSDLLYYQYFDYIVRCIAPKARSMLDIGTNKAPYLEWFHWIPDRLSVDIREPYVSEKVRGMEGDIFKLELPRFDLVSCMQVLEHVPEPEPFARRLLELGRLVLVSVPFNWPAGATKSHVNDPVDLEKLAGWFGRAPNYHLVVEEPFVVLKGTRLFAIYDVESPERRFGPGLRKRRRPAR